MSEYQYYEFQTADRPLTEEEQEAVGALSSHIEVTPTQAIVTYSYGNFKHDPKEVLADYFDAMIYLANWGSRELMFRFPKGLIALEQVRPYCLEDFITLETMGDHIVLDIQLDEEEGVDWLEGEGVLSSLLRLRGDILQGDYRVLYLAWLKAITLDDPEVVTADLEPPVPAGLQNLNSALGHFAQVFEIDSYLIEAATASSPELQERSQDALRQAIVRLPREICDDFLVRLAQGEPLLSVALNRELRTSIGSSPVQSMPRRTVAQLFGEAERLRTRARQRQAQEAEKGRIHGLQILAQNEARTWQEVEALIGKSQAKAYDEAVELLLKLQELAVFQGTQAAFQAQMAQLCDRYKSRRSLLERFRGAGLSMKDGTA